MVDFTFYNEVWNGKLSVDKFNAGLARAEAFVGYVVGYNKVKTEDQQIAMKKAICAALDAFDEHGYDGSAGFRLGDFSEPSNVKSGKAIAYEDVKLQLFGTGLLWGGIR